MLKTIFLISLRNLIRQKRRSFLLGIAIAFGAMILVVANSFSRGISDVLFNQIVVYVAGHISVNFSERGNYFRQIFYDKQHIEKVINETITEIKSKEESIGVFGRAIGNGKSDNVIVVGFDLTAEISKEQAEQAAQNFKMIEGSFEDLRDPTKENPVILARKKAEYLNVKMGDVVRVRFTNVLGQEQATRFTVVGIFEPSNMFMAFPVFVELKNLKPLMGYGPNSIAPIQITIKNPKRDAARLADSLHGTLHPMSAVIPAQLNDRNNGAVAIIGFKDDSTSLLRLDTIIDIQQGKFDKGSILINNRCAEKYGYASGDTLNFTWISKHDNTTYGGTVIINGIVSIPQCTTAVAIFNPTDFYRFYYAHWPGEDSIVRSSCAVLSETHPLAECVAPQWELMERSRTTEETQQRFREMAKLRSKAVIVDVRSMYETASAVLQLESALNLITVIAVIVLFFVILIGVVNTLRMSVKERTREIGTIRSIGMQRKHVLWLFVIETTLLAFFASIVGAMFSFGVMELLKIPAFDAGDNPMGMLLVNGKLHFAPSVAAIMVFVGLICLITTVTAWFPARKAANMHPSHALRHFE